MDRAKDLLQRAVTGMLPAAKRAEFEVCMAWARAVGPEVAERTWPVRLTAGTLIVATTNAAWATELGYLAEDFRQKLNDALETDVVSHIRFVVRPRPQETDGRG